MLAKNSPSIHKKTVEPLDTYWKKKQQRFEKQLNRLIPPASRKPALIHQAMRYSLFAGGKRLRPILVLAAAESLGGKTDDAMPLAACVECIHTYSLIHDDLPCMDNDDLRRGKPTSHKVYGEGIAVLAGDALLTLAFELAASSKSRKRYTSADYVLEAAHGSGSQKLIAGQVVDLECEGKKITPAQLRYIHECKTAALITTSLRLGAMSANARPDHLEALTRFGYSLGLAFQIIDDILDITQTSEQLGKSAGKDIQAQKATYPSLLGMEKAIQEAARHTRLAETSLKPLGKKADRLHQIAAYMLDRKH
ncbi:MAG: polyprenyl synthetase family protein [Candidatus Methylacidiphilales bacterium]